MTENSCRENMHALPWWQPLTHEEAERFFGLGTPRRRSSYRADLPARMTSSWRLRSTRFSTARPRARAGNATSLIGWTRRRTLRWSRLVDWLLYSTSIQSGGSIRFVIVTGGAPRPLRLPQPAAISNIGVTQSQGGQHGYRNCQMVQCPKGLRIHSAQ